MVCAVTMDGMEHQEKILSAALFLIKYRNQDYHVNIIDTIRHSIVDHCYLMV